MGEKLGNNWTLLSDGEVQTMTCTASTGHFELTLAGQTIYIDAAKTTVTDLQTMIGEIESEYTVASGNRAQVASVKIVAGITGAPSIDEYFPRMHCMQ